MKESDITYFSKMVFIAAKECGFYTPQEIENNFDTICMIAIGLINQQKDRLLCQLLTRPDLVKLFAERYILKVNNDRNDR